MSSSFLKTSHKTPVFTLALGPPRQRPQRNASLSDTGAKGQNWAVLTVPFVSHGVYTLQLLASSTAVRVNKSEKDPLGAARMEVLFHLLWECLAKPKVLRRSHQACFSALQWWNTKSQCSPVCREIESTPRRVQVQDMFDRRDDMCLAWSSPIKSFSCKRGAEFMSVWRAWEWVSHTRNCSEKAHAMPVYHTQLELTICPSTCFQLSSSWLLWQKAAYTHH